jgi:hypothetical protein
MLERSTQVKNKANKSGNKAGRSRRPVNHDTLMSMVDANALRRGGGAKTLSISEVIKPILAK